MKVVMSIFTVESFGIEVTVNGPVVTFDRPFKSLAEFSNFMNQMIDESFFETKRVIHPEFENSRLPDDPVYIYDNKSAHSFVHGLSYVFER